MASEDKNVLSVWSETLFSLHIFDMRKSYIRKYGFAVYDFMAVTLPKGVSAAKEIWQCSAKAAFYNASVRNGSARKKEVEV